MSQKKGDPEHFIFTDRKGRIIGYEELRGVDVSENQEEKKPPIPYEIEVTKDIEVTPTEDITDIDLAINPNNEETTVEDTPNTLEPPQLPESPSKT